MAEKIATNLETALFMMNKYGLRPPISELEELAKNELIDISQDDGWHVTYKGMDLLKEGNRNP